MVCDNCGKQGARRRRITRSYGTGEGLFVVEGVPVITCPHCGETYMTAETARRLHHIRTDWTSIKQRRKVPVAKFATVKA